MNKRCYYCKRKGHIMSECDKMQQKKTKKKVNAEDEMDNMIPLDFSVPDDLLERIFMFLPLASIFRASAVCKRWYKIICSRRSLRIDRMPHNPWYFMFTRFKDEKTFAYDSTLCTWYHFAIPGVIKSGCGVSSSCGLVCIWDYSPSSYVLVCNPITGHSKKLCEPHREGDPSRYQRSFALSANRASGDYLIALVKSAVHWNIDVVGLNVHTSFSIEKYESVIGSWSTSHSEILNGWSWSGECAICNGILYCVFHPSENEIHGERNTSITMYDLTCESPQASVLSTRIEAPCKLTSARLINLGGKLLLVCGTKNPAETDMDHTLNGVGIWELQKNSWREVSMMPDRFFEGFGSRPGPVFVALGAGDLIFIQAFRRTALAIFDVVSNQWRWSEECPLAKSYPVQDLAACCLHQDFFGFCFEPRLDVKP